MTARNAFCAALVLLAPLSASAQEYIGGRDFLTEHEIDMIREAQEPNKRIETYLHFALLRLELIKQKLAVEAPGRSADIHRNLGEYSKIIDAIDMVVDDALVRDADIAKATEMITKQENEFLATLKNIDENPASDHFRYEFALDDAMEITSDSIDLMQGDLAERKQEVLESDAENKKDVVDSMAPAMRKEVEQARKAAAKREAEEKRKRPTLMKPGEKKENDR
jgi:hypothetical protein